MSVPRGTTWKADPHTLAKHHILKSYISAWFAILGQSHSQVNYIDGFCGPGEYVEGELGSPIIALRAALDHSSRLKGRVLFLFIDERPDRIKHLREMISHESIPHNFSPIVKVGRFHEVFGSVLSDVENRKVHLYPTFAFIDPFGFSGIPFAIVERLMNFERCEAFITFMVDPINRFLKHPQDKINRHIVDAFGTEEAICIAQTPGDRIKNLRVLYQKRLEEIARFVRYFEMRDRNKRLQYLLFFATNHRLGHLKMKEAMWKADPSGGFSFSDATNPDQLVMFVEQTSELMERQLSELLRTEFKSRGEISCRTAREFIEDKTPFIGKHKTATLKLMEAEGLIQVNPIRADGKKRRKNSYPDEALITFI
ncbi:MAG: three-Cys-motif partner protein TcmP [Deltaproteobacteria bacterium]|nr:three-Cys-motif partner protein TcmP [Deltaproteobacteria bacterium]